MRNRRLAWLTLLFLLLTILLDMGCSPRAAVPTQSPVPSVSTEAVPAALVPTPLIQLAPPLDWDHSAAKVPVTARDPIWGQPDAPVTIVAIMDLQCPFCARVEATLDRIKETYGPSKIRLAFLHNPLPFHSQAYAAAVAAVTVQELAGPQAFFRFVDQTLAQQRDMSEQNYVAWAVAAGVDGAAFEQAVRSKRYASKVDSDMALAKRLQANGTPAFRINGITVSGAQPYEKFVEVIDAQLGAANRLLEAGTRPLDLYVALTNQNHVAQPEPVPSASPRQAPPIDDSKTWKIPVHADDPILGEADALVTIVVFSDFECPFCQRAEKTLKAIREQYGRDVRIVWKDSPLPFHRQALPAAVLARMVFERRGNAAFWLIHDRLFDAHPNLTEEKLTALAKEYRIPWAQVTRALERGRTRERVDANLDLAGEFDVRGTPQFFINGVRVKGAQPAERFRTIIDNELVRAKALLTGGIPRARIYAEAIKDAAEPPAPERKDAPQPAAGRPSLGPPNAAVVIQEWSDFQCPFCKRVQPTLDELRKQYPTQVRIVWRHLPLPFHAQAPITAEAAEEVLAQKGNQAFWRFHDKVFAAQSDTDGLSAEHLEQLAVEAGVEVSRYRAALDGHVHRNTLEADAKLARDISISGTPAFVINGYFVSGAQPIGAFKRAVKRALGDKRLLKR